MAERRMFAKTIVLSDAFLDMNSKAKCLYFILGMVADDDGFINSPKSIMRQCGATVNDLNTLIDKKFVISFESGVIAIKHWKMNNYIQKDRKHSTVYQDEFAQLTLDDERNYHLMDTECIQDVYKMDTEVRLGKDRLDKKKEIDKERKTIPPSLDEVKAYCEERKNTVDPEKFIDFYTSKGWMVGKNKMKDWKACVRTWENKDKQSKKEVIHSAKDYSGGF